MNATHQVALKKTAMIVAGGTGGHIFPGLAVAEELLRKGWKVVWLGTTTGMESRIVPNKNIKFEGIIFSGLRGKGVFAWLSLPYRLIRAFWQSARIISKNKPHIIVGFGGYVTFPACMMGRLLRKPVVLHEQNAVMGMSNRWLSHISSKMFTAFPGLKMNSEWIGNPMRSDFLKQAAPELRFINRQGPLRVLIIGGSLGAKFLNQIVPNAIQLIPKPERPLVTHQSGVAQINELIINYKAVDVDAELTPFIDDTASAFAKADLIICRAGATTVTEISAVGAAAMFVPLPTAVDDHQTKNAMFLVANNAGFISTQNELTPEILARFIQNTDRTLLLKTAVEARKMYKPDTLISITNACEELTR